MDVLTIILIFLLVNYSDNVTESELPKYVTLPSLEAKPSSAAKEDIVIIVGRQQIEIGKEKVRYNQAEQDRERIMDGVTRILAKIQDTRGEEVSEKSRISIKADQNVNFVAIDSVLLAAASVGITGIDFVALAKQK